MGRQFKTGVPLHRRGERERSIKNDLRKSLFSATGHLHITMGDLFDDREVSYEDTLYVIEEYIDAARANPNSEFVIIRGNHDASRIAGQSSAYDVFAEAVAAIPNIHALGNNPFEIEGHLILPWHPFLTAAEMVPFSGHFKSVNGHWDVRDFTPASPGSNLIPTERLAGITARVFTGHEHKPGILRDGPPGFEAVVTGSMQPYAFGEEATPAQYLTLTLDEALQQGQSGSLHDKSVRILLRPGEQLPADLDARQIIRHAVQEDFEVGNVDVNVADFDLRRLLDESCDQHNVGEVRRERIWEEIKNT